CCGVGGAGLRRDAGLARRGGLRDRAYADWPDRGAGVSIEHVHEPLRADLRHRVDPPAVDGDVDEDRRRREVVVPETVMDTLKMPDAPACRGIETHEALGKQIVAQPVATVVVVCRCAKWQ